MLGLSGPDYISELVVADTELETGLIDYTHLGQVTERREVIDNKPTGQAPERREADYQPFGLQPPRRLH